MSTKRTLGQRPRKHCIYDPRYECGLLHEVIDHPDRVLESLPASNILKHDRTTTVALLDGEQQWVIKRYNTKDPWHAVRRTLQRSRASNCWQMSLRMTQAGIPVPAPVAFFEERIGLLRGRSFFLNEFVRGDVVTDYLERLPDQGDHLVAAMTAIFDRLKSSGISHGDMKATNILVVGGQLVFLDLDAARRCSTSAARQRGYSKDRARFLRNWQHHGQLHERFEQAISS